MYTGHVPWWYHEGKLKCGIKSAGIKDFFLNSFRSTDREGLSIKFIAQVVDFPSIWSNEFCGLVNFNCLIAWKAVEKDEECQMTESLLFFSWKLQLNGLGVFLGFRPFTYPAVGWKHSLFPQETAGDGIHHLWQQWLTCGTHDALHARQNRVSLFSLFLSMS